MLYKRISIKNIGDRGLASIFIVMIISIVIVLMVLGFVQLSNREQAQSLNRQLSLEAYYAAKSGINEVMSVIDNAISANSTNFNIDTIPSKNTCGNNNSVYTQKIYGYQNINNVGISCLIIDTTPTYLTSNVDLGNYWPFVMEVVNSNPINQINILWRNSEAPKNGISNPSCLGAQNTINNGAYDLPTSLSNNNCSAGILKVDIVSQNLQTSYTIYLYPVGNGQQPINLPSANGQMIPQGCSLTAFPSPYYCYSQINLPANNTYYLRITPIYLPASIQVSAQNGIGLTNDQVIVDSTGYAGNTIQRLRETLSLDNNNSQNFSPLDAIDSTLGICKQFSYDGTSIINNSTCSLSP